MMTARIKHFYAFRNLFLIVLLAIVGATILSHQAYAESYSSASVPADQAADAASACASLSIEYGTTFFEAQVTWISPAGNSAVDQTETPVIGGNTIPLQYNQATDYCGWPGSLPSPGNNVIDTNINVQNVSTSAGTLESQPSGQFNIAISQSSQWTVNSSSTFDFVAPNNVASATISITHQSLNEFDNNTIGGDYECVGSPPGGPFTLANGYWRTGISDFDDGGNQCVSYANAFTIPIIENTTSPPTTPPVTPPVPCPEYTTGTDEPACSPIPCPDYTTGTYEPACSPIPCPADYSGNEPNCTPLPSFTLTPDAESIALNGPSDSPTSLTFNGTITAAFNGRGGNMGYPFEISGITTTMSVEIVGLNGATIESNVPYTAYQNVNLNPTTIGPVAQTSGTATSVATVTNGSGSNVTEPVSLPPLAVGDEVCIELTVTPTSGYIENQSGTTINSSGTATSGGGTPYTVCSAPIADSPYIKIFNGDVAAGASSTDTSLCYSQQSVIDTVNNGAAPYAGSGTSLAAIATAGISGFASDQIIAALTAAKNLSMANTPSATAFGGNYTAAASTCSTSGYYEQAVADSSSGTPVANSNLAGNGAGNFYLNLGGGGTLNGGAALTVPLGQHLVVYATGPITIASNVTFATGATSASTLPTLEVVSGQSTNANGAINIDPAVTQLAGSYIAENGTIDDCAGVTAGYLYTECNSKLTVEGSFLAQTINLKRTNGTISQASASETPGKSPDSSEEFDYTPADWLAPQPDNSPAIQSITSLPPIL
jgi:hypothetical protein